MIVCAHLWFTCVECIHCVRAYSTPGDTAIIYIYFNAHTRYTRTHSSFFFFLLSLRTNAPVRHYVVVSTYNLHVPSSSCIMLLLLLLLVLCICAGNCHASAKSASTYTSLNFMRLSQQFTHIENMKNINKFPKKFLRRRQNDARKRTIKKNQLCHRRRIYTHILCAEQRQEKYRTRNALAQTLHVDSCVFVLPVKQSKERRSSQFHASSSSSGT